MKIYLNEDVFQAALDRTRRIFDEFDNVVVSFSGGKDSTVTLEIALIVAREKNRLPLKVCFIDQEAEWKCVIDYIKSVMYRDEIEPLWIQVPIFLPNALSQENPYLTAWEPGKEWMREKDPIAIKDGFDLEDVGKEVKLGYWYTYFVRALDILYPDEPSCFLAGMRAEESPARLSGLTNGSTYKDITWGKKLSAKKKHFNFYPLYDWCLSDIWKAIHDNNWEYCEVYDHMYRHGVSPHKMRVSNLHHETAIHVLFYLHEVEMDTWNALNKRLGGINQAKHMKKEQMLNPKELPFMFKDWKEYRDYLTEKLISSEKLRKVFRKKWAEMDEFYNEMLHPEHLYRKQIGSILVGDAEFAKLSSFVEAGPMITYRRWKRGVLDDPGRAKYDYKFTPEGEYHG